MSSSLLPVGGPLAVAMVALVALAVAVSMAGRLGHGRGVVTAAVRAVLQLAGVSLILVAVVGAGWLTAAFIALMYVTASLTAARRLTRDRSGLWASAAVVLATLPIVVVLVVVGVLPTKPLALIPVTGILIGGVLMATVLAGRRALDEFRLRHGEIEAALSVGLLPRDAVLEIVRPSASGAMIPVLDQTRTVGLVTLPGAFVGMLIGGASPVDAGVVQLFVLIALMAAEAIAVVVTIELVARGAIIRT